MKTPQTAVWNCCFAAAGISVIMFSLLFSLQLHSDGDRGDGSVRYVLTGEGAGTLFKIDEKSGDIHATKRLDREEKAYYILHAKAINRFTNEALEGQSEFIIKIHDINDNEPRFTKDVYTARVPEMSDIGKFMLHIFLMRSSCWSSTRQACEMWNHDDNIVIEIDNWQFWADFKVFWGVILCDIQQGKAINTIQTWPWNIFCQNSPDSVSLSGVWVQIFPFSISFYFVGSILVWNLLFYTSCLCGFLPLLLAFMSPSPR